MKHVSILRGLAAALLPLVLVAGCGDNTTDPPTPAPTTGMTATIDGVAWSSTSVTAAYVSGAIGAIGNRISGANNKAINFNCAATAPGTYPVGPTGVMSTYTEITDGVSRTFLATSGAVKIDELSGSGAKGTFEFELLEYLPGGGTTGQRRSVKNGTFNLKF